MGVIKKIMETQIVTITTPSFEVQVNDAFAPFEAQFKEWQDKAKLITVTDVSHKDGMQQAREARLALRGVRTSVDKKRKELKDDSLKTGRLIDSIGNRIIDAIESIEKNLQEKEDFEKNMLAAQHRALQSERAALLQPWTDQDTKLMPLADTPEDSFGMMLKGYKEAHAEKQRQKEEAERQRIERDKFDAEERQRLKEENDRMRHEKAKQDEFMAMVHNRISDFSVMGYAWSEEYQHYFIKYPTDFCSVSMVEIKNMNQQSYDLLLTKLKGYHAKHQNEMKLKHEHEAAERKERDERAAQLERESRDREVKEEADRKAKAASDRKAKRAPDKVKLLSFAERLELQNCENLKDDDAQVILANAIGLMAKVTKYIRDNAEKL